MTSLSATQSLSQRLDGIGEVECLIPDMNGIPRGKVIHARNFIEGRRVQMAHGVLVQCLTGEYPDPRYYGYDDSDFILRPLPDQLHITPWTATPRALALCEVLEMDGAPSKLSSRSMLQRVVEDYAARGWSPKVATEMEFYLFEQNADVQQPFRPPVGLDGRREVGSQAFAVGSVTGLQPFFAELKAGMAALGIPCEAVMHEMGLSQYEVNFTHDDPLLIADQTFLFKYLLHEVALKHGLIAVCMAKPLSKMPGSSMHIHQSVVDQKGQNIFTDPDSLQATAEFRHYLGGMQAHLGDLILLMAPNINSYQRYCHTYASPNNLCWSNDNRRTGLRVPASEPDARRVENRVPGADANPYLAVAASLAAGLYGIEHALEPDLPAQGEFEVPEDLRLSCTLHRAIRRLERSSMAREAFTDEFVEGYLACKRMELEHFLDEISPWERRFLGSVI